MKPKEHPANTPQTKVDGPPSARRSGERRLPEIPAGERQGANPIGGATFRTLRALRITLGTGGIPPIDQRTSEDEARVAAFFVLTEMTHILDQFRRAVEQGQPCHLVVSEHGRQRGKVVLEIAIEWVRP